jgi:hypothetical protein
VLILNIEQEQKVGACWECGYSLRGLETPRCPECGRGFDPVDATTMNMGIEVGPVRRFLMRPPGWPVYLLTAMAALWSLWAAATPTPPGMFVNTLGEFEEWHSYAAHLYLAKGRFLCGALLWTVVLSTWATRRMARGITVMRLSKHRPAAFAYWRRWLWPLVVFLFTVLICLTSLPVLGGFWLSRGALNAAVQNSAPANPDSQWIGIYPVAFDQATAVGSAGGMKLVLLGNPVSDRGLSGFVYCDPKIELHDALISIVLGQKTRCKWLAKGWYSFRMLGPHGE